MESHKKFKAKYDIPFPLLADTEGMLHDAFGAGKRTTFLIDASGKILKVWAHVSVEGHASDVLNGL